jgi:hypothetical protein
LDDFGEWNEFQNKMILEEYSDAFAIRAVPHYLVMLHADGAMTMVSFFVLVVLVVVVENKHNSSIVSFQVMENEIVREDTIL